MKTRGFKRKRQNREARHLFALYWHKAVTRMYADLDRALTNRAPVSNPGHPFDLITPSIVDDIIDHALALGYIVRGPLP